MANKEHLVILGDGVDQWNAWREENPEVEPDLSRTSLNGADLDGADLNDANLSGAKLSSTKLSRAKLIRADLRYADLRNADLNGAYLSGTHLTSADLRGTHLIHADLSSTDLAGTLLSGACISDANLYGAYLRGTALSDTALSGAVFGATSLSGVDLSLASGLETTRHVSPSAISTTTLERTAEGLGRNNSRQGEVEKFLRAAGVTEMYMEAFRDSIGQPIEFYSCFISYSHNDKGFARRLYDHLQGRGIRCWLDEHEMKAGDRILDTVNNAIRMHDKIILCCSEASLNSWWVQDEVRKAQDRERRDKSLIIVPLDLDGYLFGWDDGLASDLTSRFAPDFTGWESDNAKFEEKFELVVKALRADELAREKPPESKL